MTPSLRNACTHGSCGLADRSKNVHADGIKDGQARRIRRCDARLGLNMACHAALGRAISRVCASEQSTAATLRPCWTVPWQPSAVPTEAARSDLHSPNLLLPLPYTCAFRDSSLVAELAHTPPDAGFGGEDVPALVLPLVLAPDVEALRLPFPDVEALAREDGEVAGAEAETERREGELARTTPKME
ncbi:hypothetical protein E2562_030461 [Oryza meyeriana var. granulata]|uniref:Uncharacterized protein n=1 Tax=Oryza meyeriana var. granulata TaxID=110450 RepID=A0A6G1CJN3_9ORYZ|nr:hypothetical protein E2562_030461 [Oryza meyeriana var. granulata]